MSGKEPTIERSMKVNFTNTDCVARDRRAVFGTRTLSTVPEKDRRRHGQLVSGFHSFAVSAVSELTAAIQWGTYLARDIVDFGLVRMACDSTACT